MFPLLKDLLWKFWDLFVIFFFPIFMSLGAICLMFFSVYYFVESVYVPALWFALGGTFLFYNWNIFFKMSFSRWIELLKEVLFER